MSTSKLSYAVLEKLADTKAGHNLELAQVSVARFADDRSPIELGVTVPFVARFSLLATTAAVKLLRAAGITLQAGDVVLRVNPSGEVESGPGVELAGDAPQWLADHYAFAFEVHGIDRSAFRPHRLSPVDEDDYPSFYPWIQEITTLAVRGELIDIELDIEPRDPPVRARKRIVLTRNALQVPMDQALVRLALEVDGDYQAPASLANGQYWIALHSDHQPDLKLRVAVHGIAVHAAPGKTAELPPPDEPPPPPSDDRGYEPPRARRNQPQ